MRGAEPAPDRAIAILADDRTQHEQDSQSTVAAAGAEHRQHAAGHIAEGEEVLHVQETADASLPPGSVCTVLCIT